MKSQAAILIHINEPLIIDEVSIPSIKPGQVLVKIMYSGLCRSQLMEVTGGRGEDKYLPHLLGHEGSGIVIAVGEKVTKVNVGDKVILSWIKSKGLDEGGVQYKLGDRIINAGAVTTLNEYAVVSENRCVKCPAGVPLDVAVLFGCALPTGAGIIINELSARPDSDIAVWGLGGVGLSALAAAGLHPFKRIIAIDVKEAKLNLAKEFGATHCINAEKENPLTAVMNLTGGIGADYCVEASGRNSNIELAFKAVKKHGGLCVFASHPPAGEKICLDPYDLICGKQLRGTWGGACDPDRDISRFAELYTKKPSAFEKMLSAPYALCEINQALDDLAAGKIFRALIKIGRDQ